VLATMADKYVMEIITTEDLGRTTGTVVPSRDVYLMVRII
jgi:hypothetical protein